MALSGKRVLLAEDSEINQLVVQAVLDSWAVEVSVVSDGEQAVVAVASSSQPFDAVIMDLHMPVVDGYEAALRIRAFGGRGKVPIIAMSADSSGEVRARCRECGITDLVTKPIDPDLLFETLIAAIPRR